jgi:hypothetical protein
MFQEPRFDRTQFAGRRSKAVSAKTGISFADFGNMHIHHREVCQERRLKTPTWAVNDLQLRQVVLRFAEDRLYIRDHSGSDAERMARIHEEEQRRLPAFKQQLEQLQLAHHKNPQAHLTIQIQNMDSAVLTMERGVVKLATAVVYAYYRQGHKSVEIAEQFGVKPPAVRVWLYRMHTVSNRLGFGTGPVVRSSGADHGTKAPEHSVYYTKENALKLFVLRAAGGSWSQCRRAFKLDPVMAKHIWARYFGDLKVVGTQLPKGIHIQAKSMERLRALFALRTNGKTWQQCADHLGMIDEAATFALWKRHFGKLNVGPVRRRRRGPHGQRSATYIQWTNEQLAQLKALRESGKTFQVCANEMGITTKNPIQTVQSVYTRYCKVKGQEPAPSSRP